MNANNNDQGKVLGIVTGSEDEVNSPLPFVNVIVSGSSIGSTTDFDGKYEIILPIGTHQLVFSYIGYDADTLTVQIIDNSSIELNHQLSKQSITIEAVNVKAKANREGEVTLNLDRINADKLTQNIGAKELSKKGASNAADGLKKVVGISLQGSGFFLIRGLGDRYNNALVNGLPVASPNPDRKVLPLDLFPSDVIQSLTVYKSFSPELYGDVAGGTVSIQTKEFTEKPVLKLGVGLGYNTNSTFKNFMKAPNEKGDYLGLGQNSRDMPSEVTSINSYDSRNNGYLFENNNNANYINAPLNHNYNLLYSNFFNTKGENGLGILLSASHDIEYTAVNGQYILANKQGIEKINYDFDRFNFSTSSSILANLVYKINSNNSIRFNGMYLNISDEEARDASGSHFDYSGDLFSRRFSYNNNNVLAQQLSGAHKIKEGKWEFNWAGSYNNAHSSQPDRRQFVYQKNETGLWDFNALDINENHRFYSHLAEAEIATKAEIKLNAIPYQNDGNRLSLTFGLNTKTKNRNFDFRQFNYNLNGMDLSVLGDLGVENGLDPDLVDSYVNQSNHDLNLFYLDERDDPASEYKVGLNLFAGYVNSDFDIIPKRLKLIAGFRLEQSNQYIEFKNQIQPSITEKPTLDNIYLLPALSFKYTPADKHILWITGSKTVSRPGFKEVAQFDYIEYFAGETVRGNASLQNGTNLNLDLRYEFYPSKAELISVSPYLKILDNPIEKVSYAAASGRKLSFVNIESAVLAGVELEIKKRLSFLSQSYNNVFLLGANASYQYSNVSIADNTTINGIAVTVTNNDRPLQGASPFLVNADFTYQRNTEKLRTSMALVYNVFGKRIDAVGVKAANAETGIGDVYDIPVHRLDFILKGEWKQKFGFGFSAKNILNPSIIREQETDLGVIQLNNYKRGMQLGLNFTYKFL